MEFSENVVVLKRDHQTFYLVGTAHVSPKSVEEVGQVIDFVKPDAVCVELCKTRFEALTQENQWKKLNIIQVIKQGKALMLLASLALSSFQRRMGSQMGVQPGAELLAGVNKAKEVGAQLVLADRDVQVTLKRTWGNLKFWRKMMVLSGLMESVFSKEEISPEELEKLKEKDQLSAMMEEFAKAMPEVKEPLIDERDRFLMSKIQETEGEKVVAVVGAGHLAGMQAYFGNEVDRDTINTIPPKSKWITVLKWLIPTVVLLLFLKGYHDNANESLKDMFMAWILPNSIFSGLFALIGGAKFITVLTAALAAPITSLNPAIGAGMVAGLVEGWLRKPTVEDCEKIPEDIQSFKGFYRNPFTKVLLIFLLVSLGSALGTWVGIYWLVALIS